MPGAEGYVCSRGSAPGDTRSVQLVKPDLAGVPPMQRRRLGPLARAVFHVLAGVMEEVRDEPVIFSTRSGEIQRTQGILEAIASAEQVSPAAFSLAVHNGIAGLWSLVHGVHAPMLSIAPVNGSPVPALLEAFAHLASGEAPAVSVVCYEEALPEFYAPFLQGPAGPTALALRLSAPEEARLVLSLSRREAAGSSAVPTAQGIAALHELLMDQDTAVVIPEVHCDWRLQLAA